MFVLIEMTEDLRINPANLGQDRVEAVTNELNLKLSNRVILNTGLCLALWDVTSIGPGMIYPGDGGVHSKVTFRYIVFRPFHGEVIVGKIKKCAPEGIYGFFEDIFVKQEYLQFPSKFNEKEQVWVWKYKGEDADETHDMCMGEGDAIKFRVSGESYTDTTPSDLVNGTTSDPQSNDPQPSTSKATSWAQESGANELGKPPKIPYLLTGSMNEPGLGLISWWN